MSTFLTGDIHKGHLGILKFCASTRHFRNIQEHDDFVLKSWRQVVRDDDTVIVGGDFAHGNIEAKELRRFFLSLPGKKVLVKGNHDGPATLALPWESVHDILRVSIDSQRAVICHYAMRSWEGIRKGALMLYGHHHGRLPGNSQSCDIGVDVHGFVPQRMNQIKSYMKTLPPLVDPEGSNFGADIDGGPQP